MPPRTLIPACLAVAAALVCAAPASARIVEVGSSPSTPAIAPTCPSDPCLAVSRTTGYQVKAGERRGLFTVPANGRIVAWSITLGRPNGVQREFFERNFGRASAGISVLRPGDRLFSRVVAASPIYQLSSYFGRTVQFPLARSLRVKKGYVVALTVPTWAPALTGLLDDQSSWRASRARGACDETERQTAQTRARSLTQYRCLYKARLTYTATLVTTPRPNKN